MQDDPNCGTNPSKSPMKSINFLLPVHQFQTLKVYATCKSITLRELCYTVINSWMEQNENEIYETIDIKGIKRD